MWTLPAGVLVALVAGGGGASGLVPPQADEPTPELSQKINILFQRAGGQYQRKDYRKAIESYRELLALVPPGPRYDRLRAMTHYSIAGSYALLGEVTEALGQLDRAAEHGLESLLRDIERNSDFDAVRRSPDYSALAEKVRRKAEERAERARAEERRRYAALDDFEFALTAVDGKTIARKDFRGKVLIVDVWGTWCPPCLQEVPHFVELHRRHEAQGLRIVGLNSEKVRDRVEAERRVRAAVERMRIPYPCALATDEVLRSIPSLQAFPTTIFFGRDGKVRSVQVGYRDLAALEAIVKPLLAEAGPKP